MNVQNWLIKGWLFSMGFIYLLDLPYVGTKLQLPEIMLLLTAFWVIKNRELVWRKIELPHNHLIRYYAFEGAVFIFLFIALLSTILHPTKSSFLENVGYWYLFMTSIIVQRVAREIEKPFDFFQKILIQLGIVLALVNIGLFVFHFLGVGMVSSLVEAKNIPPLGIFPRVMGFMPGANLLADLMGLCWLMTLSWDAPQGKYGRSLLILLGLILTFSKSILILLPLGIYIWIKRRRGAGKRGLVSLKVLIVLSALVYVFLTHVLVQPKSSDSSGLAGESYLTGEIIAETNTLVFWETSYLRLKQMHVMAAARSPLLGVGPGNFNSFLNKARMEGHFPDHLPDYDPHSTLGGSLAEVGLLGLLAVLLVAFVVFYMIRKEWPDKQNEAFYIALGCYFIFIGIETFTTDILNFRHLWVCLGLLAWDFKRTIHAKN